MIRQKKIAIILNWVRLFVTKSTGLCRQTICNNGTNYNVVDLEISNDAARSHPREVSICFNTAEGAVQEKSALVGTIFNAQEAKINDEIHVNRTGWDVNM
jgi:hypothetical protein